MSFDINNDLLNRITKEMYRQTENLVLEHLNDLVSRDLIRIEYGPKSFVHDFDSGKVIIQQTVKLTLKDKEYIEKLEKVNKELKEALDKITNVIKKDE